MRLQILLCFALALTGCKKAESQLVVEEPAWERSFDRGIDFLLSRQSKDGAWCSDLYGHFREGDALTPLVIVALLRAPESEKTRAAIARGLEWMGQFGCPDGTIDPEAHFAYPVYTAALMVQALSDPRQQESLKTRDAWVRFLLSYQLTEQLGWKPSDPQFGGWGYSGVLPQKPKDGPIPEAFDANISATAYALSALRALGRPRPEWASRIENAHDFVARCQNYRSRESTSDLDDGGFFFTPDDPFRNKAGSADKDAHRFRSYGSATADGIRCLAALSTSEEVLRLEAARGWFERHLPPERPFCNAGLFAPDRETNRDAALFYCAASMNDLIRANLLPNGEGIRDRIREELVRRQLADGSWRNELNQVREDDPLLATALAVKGLR